MLRKNGGKMKKLFFDFLSLFGMWVMLSVELQARSFLSKVSSVVIIFTVLAGAIVWIFATKKRRELEE